MKVEESLLKSCQKDDRMAQFKLYELCFPSLMGVCLRYEHNYEDARYMLNIGFMKIITNLDKCPGSKSFEPWARRIMINTLIDEYRSKKRMKEHIVYDEIENGVYEKENIAVNQSEHKFDAEELELMIQSLPEDTRKVFNLFAIDGYAHHEIADMLNIPVGTSKWHVSKARTALQEMIQNKIQHSKVAVK